MSKWQVGDFTVTRVIEIEVAGGTKFLLPQATPEAVRDFKWMAPHFMTPDGHLIMSVHALVIDTGDRTFPNARYLMAEKEFTYWQSQESDAGQKVVFADSVKPVFDAGLVDLIPLDHKICEGIWLEPTVGHTPGHVSVRLSSKGEEAIITGDFIHHPCQLARPDWCAVVDYDPAQSEATRRDVFARYADTPMLVIGTHFATPAAGHIKRDGDAYRLDV